MKKFDNYVSALEALSQAPKQDLSNEFVQSGVIGKFSLQFELGWKLMKTLLAYEGDSAAASGSPRDIIKAGFRCFDFIDEDMWLRMLRDRNDTTHIYGADRARRLVDAIIEDYLPEFLRLRKGIEERYGVLLATGAEELTPL